MVSGTLYRTHVFSLDAVTSELIADSLESPIQKRGAFLVIAFACDDDARRGVVAMSGNEFLRDHQYYVPPLFGNGGGARIEKNGK
jgi:hypothetical protein